ncbi:gem-associated protein 4 [Cheilinus undulatus]|uniref:gem-associated protein 4 n=1 Tax=Cheilinus undulatus TaxID=241271 RepID=UPI001BD356D8|nr:gem-associated protein 4 [Cheilinus undulatus]
MTLTLDKDWAVVQGAFILADKLCLPSSLSSLQKAEWSRVGHPVPEAAEAICKQNEPPSTLAVSWVKKILCAVWLKLLCREAGEDVEVAWRENPFFPLLNSLPEVNHVVLLELVKSLAAAKMFSHLLSYLPQSQVCVELNRLVQHVKNGPTTEDDVRLFLEVWWELWKGREEKKTCAEDNIETMFAKQFVRFYSESPGVAHQAAKRLKLDPSELPASSNNDVLHILLYALNDIKHVISTTALCFEALSISLDALYTTFLIDQAVVLPTKEKMLILSKAVGIKENNNEKISPEIIQDAQRDLHASHTPSQFPPIRMKLGDTLKIIRELVEFWINIGLLRVCDSSGSWYSTFKLEQSAKRVMRALYNEEMPETVTEKNLLKGLLESLTFTAIESDPEVNYKVTAMIIKHRLDDCQEFAMLFASEMSWAAHSEHWIECLEENQAAFQQHDTLIRLTSTFMSKLHSQSTNVSQSRKLMKVIADIFSALSLKDKNKVLAVMLRLSSKGFFGCSVPSAVTNGFEQELNMAFNCITQGGGAAAASQSNLNSAVSLVARVAYQNPEAALRSCCLSAVFNKGAFSLMAKILQQLPGLREQRGRNTQSDEEERKESEEREDGERDAASGCSLLCRCLQEIINTKSLSANEKEQLLKFLSLLMIPDMMVEGDERKGSFLPPQEVINIFVLPNLSTMGQGCFDVELSLQLLHTALCLDVQEEASSPHWVMDCSPFPLLYVLAQLKNQTLRCWEQPPEGTAILWSMDTKELLVSVLTILGQVVGAEVLAAPSRWSRALFWLYNKMEKLDWTVRFLLKPVWGDHFKNEVPSALLTVCDLPEQDWSGLDLSQYGPGTGLLAWMECCSVSDPLQSTMLAHLSLDRRQPHHVSMFSKGLLVALTQTLPWCSVSQWSRLLKVLKELIISGRLHVPFSLEYVDYLPLLDLKKFSCDLRLSVLLLRVLQLLCGSSCSDWLSRDGWAHVGRLYAHAVREMMNSVRAKLPLSSSGALNVSASTSLKTPGSNLSCTQVRCLSVPKDCMKDLRPAEDFPLETEEEMKTAPCQEVLFVLSQLFCHVQHIQVMMPGGQSEPLFLSSLEILSHYEAIMAAFPHSSSPLETDNTRHFFSTITDNLVNEEMKAVLQQKIAQLVSSAA